MSQKTELVKETATTICNDTEALSKTAEDLCGTSRRARQFAASVFSEIARMDATLLAPYIDQIVSGLDQKESQTRWECLGCLTELVSVNSRGCDKALEGAEDALFDEDNGLVRLAAVRFLCRLGSTTENRSEKVWPLLDEAIQCYHGDYEYQDMLIALVSFSEGKLSDGVKAELKERVAFDAEFSKGPLGKRSQQIIDNLS